MFRKKSKVILSKKIYVLSLEFRRVRIFRRGFKSVQRCCLQVSNIAAWDNAGGRQRNFFRNYEQY